MRDGGPPFSVPVGKRYRFTGPAGPVYLLDLFEGRRRLITYHFKFEPDRDEGCAHCAYLVANIGRLDRFHVHDTTLALVSCVPLAAIERYRARHGWSIPWYSAEPEFVRDFPVGVRAAPDEPAGVSVFDRSGATVHARTAYPVAVPPRN